MQKQSFNATNSTPPDVVRMFGWFDGIIVLVVITVCIATLPTLKAMQPGKVVIYRDNRVLATYPLDMDQEIALKGNHGPVVIAIKNHIVSVIQSDCPHKLCQMTGGITAPNSQIVCVPNHLLITITSTGRDTIDGVAR